MARSPRISLPATITEKFIERLNVICHGQKKGYRGAAVKFPTSVPCEWVTLPDGTVLRAVERGDELVAV